MIRILLVLLVVGAMAVTASSCGRRAPPEFPPESDYPRQYPAR